MITISDIKRLSELRDRKGRRAQKLFLIEGVRSVSEALEEGAGVRKIILDLGANSDRFESVFSSAKEQGIEIEEIPATKFRKLSTTESSQGIIAVASIPEFTFEDLSSEIRSKRSATILILDRVSDPGNLGTILRSAAWFGIDGIVVAGSSVDVYNPKVVRSAMAAVLRLKVVQEADLNEVMPELHKVGFAVIASTQDGKASCFEYGFPLKLAIVLGSEASGISKEISQVCDASVFIPRVGKMESLNVGVAASIVMAEIARQRK